MKKIFTIILSVLWIANGFAQQEVQYSQYMFNQFRINPAFAGLDNSLSATGVYRDQWVGLEGRPQTQNFNVHMPFYYLRGGIGLNIENDIAGAERNLKASATYAYHFPLKKFGVLSIAATAGVIQKRLDGNILRAPDGLYGLDPNVISHEDPELSEGIESAIAPNFASGIFLKGERFQLGVSATNIAESVISFTFSEGSEIKLSRTYFGFASYDFEIGSSFNLMPSLLFKSDAIENQIEFSTILKYNDNIFLGASFRGYEKNSMDAIVALAGLKLNNHFTLSYSYDITLSGLNQVSKGSHEILVNYNLNKPIGKGIPQKIIYNPRFL